jgi:hypothetical protein
MLRPLYLTRISDQRCGSTIFGTIGAGYYRPRPPPRKYDLKTDRETANRGPQTYLKLCSAHAGAFSPPRLRFARLGPERPLLGLFKFSSGTLWIWDGRHEAHFAPTRDDRDNCFAADLMAAPGSAGCLAPPPGPLDPIRPMVVSADPSVRVRQNSDFVIYWPMCKVGRPTNPGACCDPK